MSTAPALQAPTRLSGQRPLLVERAAMVLRRVFGSMGQAWARQRRRQAAARPLSRSAGKSAGLGAGISALLGRTLTGRRPGGRMLAVEERLALGPKQHLYVIRCGEQRMLLASAAEGSLQWMALPEVPAAESENARDNTRREWSGTRAAGKRRAAKGATDATEEGTAARRAVRRTVGRAERRAGAEGVR
ncbi:MAG: flagellar biosynthetic protein FliO [Acidobacteriaceae bacterium]